MKTEKKKLSKLYNLRHLLDLRNDQAYKIRSTNMGNTGEGMKWLASHMKKEKIEYVPIPLPNYRDSIKNNKFRKYFQEISKSNDPYNILNILISAERELANVDFMYTQDDLYGDEHDYNELRWACELLANVLKRYISIESIYKIDISKYDKNRSNIILLTNRISEELIKYISKEPDSLYQINPRQFEKLIAEILFKLGWDVELTPAVKDGGFDLFAIVNSDLAGVKTYYLVECKRYTPPRKVGINIAREILYLKGKLSVPNALLVTTTDFTRGVYDLKSEIYDFDTKNFNDIIDWCNKIC